MPQIYDSAYWQCRAEEARAIADEMSDRGAQETMRRLAASWDDMAKRAALEEQLHLKAS